MLAGQRSTSSSKEEILAGVSLLFQMKANREYQGEVEADNNHADRGEADESWRADNE